MITNELHDNLVEYKRITPWEYDILLFEIYFSGFYHYGRGYYYPKGSNNKCLMFLVEKKLNDHSIPIIAMIIDIIQQFDITSSFDISNMI